MLILKTLPAGLILVTPDSTAEMESLYQLRWEILRQPLGLSPGSEQDQMEETSTHRMIWDPVSKLALASGRIHAVNPNEAQIRYMAVARQAQGMGLGKLILEALEVVAAEKSWPEIWLNAREEALPFYLKSGYQNQGEIDPILGIRHFRMTKSVIQ
jgi:predicted GNAT family N-acyltransferase